MGTHTSIPISWGGDIEFRRPCSGDTLHVAYLPEKLGKSKYSSSKAVPFIQLFYFSKNRSPRPWSPIFPETAVPDPGPQFFPKPWSPTLDPFFPLNPGPRPWTSVFPKPWSLTLDPMFQKSWFPTLDPYFPNTVVPDPGPLFFQKPWFPLGSTVDHVIFRKG